MADVYAARNVLLGAEITLETFEQRPRAGPATQIGNCPPLQRGWNAGMQTEEPVETLKERNLKLLKDRVIGHKGANPKIDWDKYFEWGRTFFGEKSLLIHIQRGCVYLNTLHGRADGFPNCCGYAEVYVGNAVDSAIKNRMAYAWVARNAGVIASINWEQARLLDELTTLGFRVVQDWHVNPNSGNKIMMLIFTFPQEELVK